MGSAVEDYERTELSEERVAEALAAGGVDLAALVDRQLWDGRDFMRRNAAAALKLAGRVEHPNLTWLTVAAKDADPVVRRHVAGALGGVGLPVEEAVPALLQLATDPVAAVAEVAVEALDRLVLDQPEPTVAALVPALGDPRPAVLRVVAQRLLRKAEVAAPRLVTELSLSDGRVAEGALAVLGEMLDAASAPLVEALQIPSVRDRAARLLVRLHGLAPPVRARLEALAGDGDAALAETARRVLAETDRPRPQPTLPPPFPHPDFAARVLTEEELDALAGDGTLGATFARALQDGRAPVRANAVGLVARAAGAEAAGPALVALARDPEPAVREAVARALTRLGDDAAARALVAMAGDRTFPVATAAREGLEALAAGHAEALLEEGAVTASAEILKAVVQALVRAGKAVVPALTRALADAPRPPTRALAALVLGHLGEAPTDAVSALASALGDDSEHVREDAATSLGRVGREHAAAAEGLEAAAQDSSPRVRRAASAALDHLRGRPDRGRGAAEAMTLPVAGFAEAALSAEALAVLADDLDEAWIARALADGRPAVRQNAARLLAVHAASARAPALLAPLVRDADEGVRAAAVDVLAGVGGPAVIGSLAAAAGDRAPSVAHAARRALASGAIGDAGALLAAARGAASPEGREAALEGVVAQGARAVPALGEALRKATHPELRRLAAVAVARLGARAAPAVPALVEAMSDPVTAVRAEAAVALGEAGAGKKEAVAALDAAAADPVAAVRQAAALAARRVRGLPPPDLPPADPAPWPVPGFEADFLDRAALAKAAKALDRARLLGALADGRPAVRHNAVVALPAAAGDVAAVGLARALRDGDARVRRAAAESLAELGPAADAASPALAQALRDRDPAVAGAAAHALRAMGPAALPALTAALADASPALATTLLSLVNGAGKAGGEALVACLDHPSDAVRGHGAAGLWMLATAAPPSARAALERGARSDPSAPVRRACREALDAVLGRPPAPVAREAAPLPADGFAAGPMADKALQDVAKKLDLPRLTELLFDGRLAARENAARALGHGGAAAHPAVPALCVALKDSEEAVRTAAAEALGRLRHDAELSVIALGRALRRATGDMRAAALEAIDAFGDDGTAPLLRLLEDRPDVAIAGLAPVTLRQPKRFVPALMDALRTHPSPLVRESAVDVLAEVGDTAARAEPLLLEVLAEPDVPLRCKVIRALGRVAKPTPELRARLREVAEADGRPSVVLAAREALAMLRHRAG